MAFAAANTQSTVFGNLRVTYGTWSAAVGDAAGSVKVQGGKVWLASFTSQDSSGNQLMWPVKVSPSGTSGVVTLTVYNQGAVTDGKFIIIHS